MESVLYADVLFLIDFCMDYLSLYAAGKLLSLPMKLGRTVLAALLGGLYGVLAVLLRVDGFPGVLVAVGISLGMTLVAFGMREGVRGLFRTAFTVWGAGVLLGGAMTAISGLFGTSGEYAAGGGSLLVSILLAMLGLARFSRQRFTRGTAEVVITAGEVRWEGKGLLDSGNLLTDPIGGHPVILLRAEAARSLLGEAVDTIFRGEAVTGAVGIRVIPVHTVNETRILYGFFGKDILLRQGKRVRHRCAVVCVDHNAEGYGGCDALLPISLML